MVDVKKLREKLGMSKRDFAERVGVSVRSVEMWEKGDSTPSGSALLLLQMLEVGSEKISATAKDNAVSVAAGKGSNVKVGTETERFISVVESQLEMIKKRDEQIDRLLTLLEKK